MRPWVMLCETFRGSFSFCRPEDSDESTRIDTFDDELGGSTTQAKLKVSQSLDEKVEPVNIRRRLEEEAQINDQSLDMMLYRNVEQANAEQTLKVVFESDGEHYPVFFTQLPLGLIFNPELPMVVDKTFDIAARLGVKVGWVVKSVNDQDIQESDMTYDQVVELIKKGKQQLPSSRALRVVFESKGAQHVVVFTQKPLGLTFRPEVPLVVEEASEATKRLGVREGWVVKKVNDQDISNCSMSYIDLVQFMKILTEKLKPAPPICMC